MTPEYAPEFSRPVRAVALARGENVFEIEAEADERSALARRFELIAVERLRARIVLEPSGGGLYVRLGGRMVADVIQACVVTLAPVHQHIEADLKRLYGPPDDDKGSGGRIDLSPGAEEPADPLVEGALDMGEAVAEQLILELDPFPRAPGALFPGYAAAPPGPAGSAGSANGPFAALGRWRDRKGRGSR